MGFSFLLKVWPCLTFAEEEGYSIEWDLIRIKRVREGYAHLYSEVVFHNGGTALQGIQGMSGGAGSNIFKRRELRCSWGAFKTPTVHNKLRWNFQLLLCNTENLLVLINLIAIQSWFRFFSFSEFHCFYKILVIHTMDCNWPFHNRGWRDPLFELGLYLSVVGCEKYIEVSNS